MPRKADYDARKQRGVCVECPNMARPFVRCDHCRAERLRARLRRPSLKGRKTVSLTETCAARFYRTQWAAHWRGCGRCAPCRRREHGEEGA